MRRVLGLAVASVMGLSCSKVPIIDIYASFGLADASWFAEEETLFVFYEVRAEQGLNEESIVEITYITDEGRMPWTPLADLPFVHTHLPVTCETSDTSGDSLCGSASLHVPLRPRGVDIRLRYHREGALALSTDTVFNVVEPGQAHSNRSLIIYGVFDETNQRVQWRSRNQFPTLRNERATELGLRRTFTIQDQRFGTDTFATPTNPYGYGITCPSDFVETGFLDLTTNERAHFEPYILPLGASEATTVCALATASDATGTFTTGAIARKNPEVRPAFPLLRSPTRDATQLQFFLGPCDRTISAEHEAMQRQRLLFSGVPTTCTDDWQQPGFVNDLVVLFRDAVEAERPSGDDMVLVIALNQDEPGLSAALEEALAQVVPDERLRSSPRLAGAFVLDSTPYSLSQSELDPVTLWCPSTLSSGASTACAIAPDEPDFVLGPFTFGTLPILPSREEYLDFLDTYSDAQAGSVETLTFRTPEFATLSDHVAVGDFGVATFLNNEHISADSDDAFSYCADEDPQQFVFRSTLMQSDYIDEVLAEICYASAFPPEACAALLGSEIAAIQWLPDWHSAFAESSYEIGIAWDFPFLLRMNYRVVQAGAASAFGFSVPFGFASEAESYYGTPLWTQDEFSLEKTLTQCLRFCDHPTFDSAGVYHVTDPFRGTYAHNCYLPSYPTLGDPGFPLDP